MSEKRELNNQSGPCVVCGATNYPLSYGGSSICPSCDCGQTLKIGNHLYQRVDTYTRPANLCALNEDAFFKIMLPYHQGNPMQWTSLLKRLWNDQFSKFGVPIPEKTVTENLIEAKAKFGAPEVSKENLYNILTEIFYQRSEKVDIKGFDVPDVMIYPTHNLKMKIIQEFLAAFTEAQKARKG